jgi:hypothetical protein
VVRAGLEPATYGLKDAAQALAAIVLANDEVQLAQRIFGGGRLTIAYAVELAERMVSTSPEDTEQSSRADVGNSRAI